MASYINVIIVNGCSYRQAFYVKTPIGYDTESTEYFLHIDTGSGITWVMCKGRGPITAVVSVLIIEAHLVLHLLNFLAFSLSLAFVCQ